MRTDTKPRINITNSAPGASTPQKRENDGTSRSRQGTAESLETWEDKQLSHIFRLSLKPEVLKDSHGRSLYYVESVREELLEQDEPLLLKTSQLDQALTEAGTTVGAAGESPLNYLLACWKRVARALRGMRSTDTENERYVVLKEARRLCMSYCIFAVTMPEMFNVDSPAENVLAKHLLVDPESDTGICHDFLSEATSRFDEDDTIKDALVGAAEQLSGDLSRLTMNDNYKPHVLGLRNLVRYPKIVAAITASPRFLPEGIAAQDIETHSTLGPFFRLSPMQAEVATNYFSAPRTRDKAYISNAQKALRMTLQTHQGELFDIANTIVKSGKESRERLLDWFALSLNTNHKRRAMRIDYKTVSSDGFMINLTVSRASCIST